MTPARSAFFVAGLMGFAWPVLASDWPEFRGPNHDGVSPEPIRAVWPADGPKQLWKASVGIGFSSVAIAQGRAYTLGNCDGTDTVYCFDAASGKEIWKFSYACPLDAIYYEGGPGSTPTIDGARVYTLGKRGQLFCFESDTGRVVWKKNLMQDLGVVKPRWGFAGSPLVQSERLILNVGGAGTAVDKTSGTVLWTSDNSAAGYATPQPFQVDGERCVAIFSAKKLVGVRVRNGQPLWQIPWVTHWDINAPQPLLVDGDKLFVSSFGRGCALFQLDGKAPKLLWENRNMANHFNGCVGWNGFIYGVHGNTDEPERDLRCLSAKTGAVLWRKEGFGLGSVSIAHGDLIILGDHGQLAIAKASPEKFQMLASAQVLGGKCWTVPVLANGRLYCRNAQGDLVCLEVAAR